MRHLALTLAVALLPGLAGGQTLRSVVVPADVGIAIPPRGQPLPEPAPIRREMPGPRAGPPPGAVAAPAVATAPLAVGPLAIAPALILPLVAGALLGGALPGSGGSGGTGAPATTR